MKGVGRGRITKFLDDLRNEIKYWKLTGKAEGQGRWKRQFTNRTQRTNTSYLS